MSTVTTVDKTNTFAEQAAALIERGYFVVPIGSGRKWPPMNEWQHLRLTAADMVRFPDCGVGVLCGQGPDPIAAVDIDALDAGLAARFLEWCREHLGVTCERVGQAPKILLPFRAASAGWRKIQSDVFLGPNGERNKLEVLGNGQQFVAYHVHPDTKRPYEWIDLFGGLEMMHASTLPVINEDQVAGAVRMFDEMATDAGLQRVTGGSSRLNGAAPVGVDDPLMAYQPPVENFDIAKARGLLNYLGNEDYDIWLKVGMALHHQFGGDIAALTLWDDWSGSASNYTGTDDLAKRWDGFGRADRAPTTARWLMKVSQAAEHEVVKAEKRGARDELKARILACNDSIDLLGDVARSAGGAGANDPALRAELAGLIRAQFKEITGTPLSLVDLRRAMSAGTGVAMTLPERRAMSEFGNAERMLDRYGDGLRYVPELECWYNWTGTYWRRAASVELEHLAKETVRALPEEAHDIDSDDARTAFLKFCAASQRARMVDNMVRLAQSDPRVVVSVSDLDRHAYLLGVGNGAVDLRTGALVPPSPDSYITTITSIEYDPSASAPLFEQTVADVFFNNREMIQFFQRLIGYSLLGCPNEDVLVIPHGSGSNGKSTVLGVIREVLGAHARMASADTFLASRSQGSTAGGPREDVLRLRGARFVYVSEPEEGSELREGLIKSMTGGEALPARGIHAKATVEVQPTWTVFMPTNHRPIVKGDDHGIWRRLMLVPFTRNFDHDLTIEKDAKRADKLRAEAVGVLAWCVRGALEYQRLGLAAPTDVRQAREEYRSDMDLLEEWIGECCNLSEVAVDSNTRLWASWASFAQERGELRYIASSKSLARRLAQRGFESLKDCSGVRGRGMRGLCVKPVDL